VLALCVVGATLAASLSASAGDEVSYQDPLSPSCSLSDTAGVAQPNERRHHGVGS
jgi:hypothetical protein